MAKPYLSFIIDYSIHKYKAITWFTYTQINTAHAWDMCI